VPTEEHDRAAAFAELIANGFFVYHVGFNAIARRARLRFEACNWHGLQRDAGQRLDLYRRSVNAVVSALAVEPEVAAGDRAAWAPVKTAFARRVEGRADHELALTFFNSVTRRLFAFVGVDPTIEFLDADYAAGAGASAPELVTIEAEGAPATAVVERLLEAFRFRVAWEDAARDARLVADRVDEHLATLAGRPSLDAVDVLGSVFYRNKGAFVVARMRCGAHTVPLVLALLNPGDRIVVDAALVEPDDVSIVFSFTRSYFHVETEQPRGVVDFLKSIMPRKPIAELYTAIGYNKHGKTELYRSLSRHLETSSERFERAPGVRGMVMEVLAFPSFDVVFKIIRDAFDPPKTVTRREVRERYALVFQHDRAGRLVDTQEFEHLTFDRTRFPDDLLAELLRTASRTVSVEGDRVTIAHLYTERRLVPLDVFVREARAEAAVDAVVDYGNAIKDLAAADVFPGDTLLKNFGVTRHGRVVFYDYDEVRLLSECSFRRLPPSRDADDEIAADPWFSVGENDIFPEELRRFLGLPPDLAAAFEAVHGDLFEVAFWTGMQERLREGELADVFAYKQSLRFGEPIRSPGV
jgi:isocitrate dehydrogenase kinase/phosphatase